MDFPSPEPSKPEIQRSGSAVSAEKDSLDKGRPLDTYADESAIAHFGKKQQFKRNFGLISILGLGCTLMLTWEGALANIQPSLFNGGPAGAIAAFPIVVAGVFMQILVMAELGSMIPLSGGQYNWVAILAPPKWSNLLSYITGWVTTIAWQAFCASTTWINSMLLLAIVTNSNPSYEMKDWHAILVFFALVGLSIFVNTFLGRIFPSIEAMVLILHVVGFFVIMIVLAYLAPKTDPSIIFGTFINGGEFSSQTHSVLIGAVSLMFTFSGVDAATHMAEEIENARVIIPRSMILTAIINGTTGYATLILFLFSMGPVDGILGTFGFPFIKVLLDITRSQQGSTALASIILVLGISSSIGLYATASRMLWAFAREDGVPFSRFIKKIEPRTQLPVVSIGVTATISMLLALVNLGSAAAFVALTGLTVAGFYSSFAISAVIMLWRRLTVADSEIAWGPFKLGKAGVPITIIAIVFSLVGWFFSLWPPVAAVTVETFNWSLVVYFGTMGLALLWWFVSAKKTYTGPKKEI